MVVPIREGGGTRLKIIEAMALGVPVVSTTKGAEGLNAVHGEHLLIADTPLEFQAACVSLLRDAELRSRLADNGLRLAAREFDWQVLGSRFIQLVEECGRSNLRGESHRDVLVGSN
jgi:glycosyltransferase involved in cell wall biosynthesis